MSITQIKHFLIDMDGVLWQGDQPLPGLNAFFETLRARQIGFRLVSNNSVYTWQQYVEKMARLGVSIEREAIVSSAYATAGWLAGQLPGGAAVYVLGEEGLRSALSEAGFAVSWGEDAPQSAGAVVAGLDFHVSYATLYHASRLARDGALFVGSNPDRTIPTPDGLAPGAGSILAAIEAASGVSPVVVGKPNAIMFEQALKQLGAKPDETAMIGDRLETDILGGQRAGLKTALVLSGVTQRADLAASEVRPTWVFDDLAGLTEALNPAAG
jgi:4-nitrophenyl phosphatase